VRHSSGPAACTIHVLLNQSNVFQRGECIERPIRFVKQNPRVALQEVVTDHNGLRVSRASVEGGGVPPQRNFVSVRNLSLWFTRSSIRVDVAASTTGDSRPNHWRVPSGQDFTQNSTMHICQAEVASPVTIGQPFVVQSQRMQHGRV